jgi:hypothetical protein
MKAELKQGCLENGDGLKTATGFQVVAAFALLFLLTASNYAQELSRFESSRRVSSVNSLGSFQLCARAKIARKSKVVL